MICRLAEAIKQKSQPNNLIPMLSHTHIRSLSRTRSRALSRSRSLSRSLSLSLSLGVQFARNKHGARVVSKGSMGPVLGQLRSHGRKRLLLSLGQGDVGESHGTSSVRIPDTPQHTATHCNALQHTATHCNTLQHSATHCNTLQH